MRVPGCARCQEMPEGMCQIYSVEGELGKYVFNVDKAKAIVADGKHQATKVPEWMLARLLEVNDEHFPEHINHVDPNRPGILGQRLGGVCLIDGSHRARRCRRDGLPFFAYLLNLTESMSCLLYTEQVDFTPELMARELRGMLKNNPQVEKLEAELVLDGDASARECETDLRAFLTPEENARLGLIILRKV